MTCFPVPHRLFAEARLIYQFKGLEQPKNDPVVEQGNEKREDQKKPDTKLDTKDESPRSIPTETAQQLQKFQEAADAFSKKKNEQLLANAEKIAAMREKVGLQKKNAAEAADFATSVALGPAELTQSGKETKVTTAPKDGDVAAAATMEQADKTAPPPQSAVERDAGGVQAQNEKDAKKTEAAKQGSVQEAEGRGKSA